MPRVLWPLAQGRPGVEVVLTLTQSGLAWTRLLLADSGAGTVTSDFQMLLDEDDCLLCGGVPLASVLLGGAYTGTFPIYGLRVKIPALTFDQDVRVVGVNALPNGFAGLACFSFLNRFTYGNFGAADCFGLEC